MLNCEECNKSFTSKASLSSHKYRFHRNMSSNKRNTIALVNGPSIPSRRSPRKRLPSPIPNEIRKRSNLNKILHSTSGESSDSDSTMDSSDDEPQIEKPKWVKLSEDGKAHIRKNIPNSIDSDSTMDSDSSDDGAQAKKPRWVKLPDNDKSCSCKRKHYPDSSDEEPENKIQRRGKFGKMLGAKRDPKRLRVPDSSDEEPLKKMRRFTMKKKSKKSATGSNRLPAEDEIKILNEHVERLEARAKKCEEREDKKDKKLRKKDRELENKDMKITDLENTLDKREEQVKLYADQLEETRDDEMSALEKVLTNSVSIDQIHTIRHLFKGGQVNLIVDDDDVLVTIQRIFSGMLEGVIPITAPQRLYFTKEQRDFMKNLETMDINDARNYILQNMPMFIKVFYVFDMTLKLMTKAHLNFAGVVQAPDS